MRVFNLLATVIAVIAGLATLLGYFLQAGALQDVRLLLLSAVSLLAAWAVLAGALNLLLVHGKKFISQAPGWFYSLFVFLGFLAVVLVNALGPLLGWGRGAASQANSWLLIYVVGTGGAALAGLVAFFLVYAAYRVLRARRNAMTVIFVVTVVLALLALAPWPSFVPNPDFASPGGAFTLRDLLRAATRLPATAGARGLLLGIALGTVATGLRVLLGLDRPYGD